MAPLFYWLAGIYPPGSKLPDPDLIIAAGHGTHLHLLAARRARGGKSVALMKPSLPVSWFDLCLIPEHDDYQGDGNYLNTKGVLNALDSAGEHHANRAVILVGGPSKHFSWDVLSLSQQIKRLVNGSPEMSFVLTTSRRTPGDFVALIEELQLPNVQVVPVEQTQPGWVGRQLSESSVAWVTEDSVSMVYESLTAGVAVGLLNMPSRGEGRVSKGVSSLVTDGLVCRYDDDGMYKKRLKPATDFNEAVRCADWIMNQWLKES